MAAALLRISRGVQSLFSRKPVVPHHTIHTSVWWDLCHCQVPDGCEDYIAGNIRNAVANLNYDGPVSIAAYHRGLPLHIDRALTDTGVSSRYVCSGPYTSIPLSIELMSLLWFRTSMPCAFSYLFFFFFFFVIFLSFDLVDRRNCFPIQLIYQI